MCLHLVGQLSDFSQILTWRLKINMIFGLHAEKYVKIKKHNHHSFRLSNRKLPVGNTFEIFSAIL